MNIWDKLTKAVVVLLVIAGILAVGIWYVPLIQRNERQRHELGRLDDQIGKEEETNRSLRASVEASHSDPKTVERLARTYLGYAQSNELVIRFEPSNTQNRGENRSGR